MRKTCCLIGEDGQDKLCAPVEGLPECRRPRRAHIGPLMFVHLLPCLNIHTEQHTQPRYRQ
jgi:hypothetical protein